MTTETEGTLEQTSPTAAWRIAHGRDESGGTALQRQQREIQIGKSRVPAEVDGNTTEVDLFTMTLGEEAIFLVPSKTWSQLDKYKWRVQGRLPGTPAGFGGDGRPSESSRGNRRYERPRRVCEAGKSIQ